MDEHSVSQGAGPEPDFPGLHVAIIMDGNGRWATARGRRREWGHRKGAESVRSVVRAAPDLGINRGCIRGSRARKRARKR